LSAGRAGAGSPHWQDQDCNRQHGEPFECLIQQLLPTVGHGLGLQLAKLLALQCSLIMWLHTLQCGVVHMWGMGPHGCCYSSATVTL
jgi:hypothetical protein